jgi:hypothetical protein
LSSNLIRHENRPRERCRKPSKTSWRASSRRWKAQTVTGSQEARILCEMIMVSKEAD